MLSQLIEKVKHYFHLKRIRGNFDFAMMRSVTNATYSVRRIRAICSLTATASGIKTISTALNTNPSLFSFFMFVVSLTSLSMTGLTKMSSAILYFSLRSGPHGASLGKRSIPAMSFPKWVGILVLLARLFSFRFRFSC